MVVGGVVGDRPQVALLAEGVDRNQIQKLLEKDARGRPPRGGRG